MSGNRAPALSMNACSRIAEKLAFVLCDLRVSLAEGNRECRDDIEKLESLFDGDGPSRTPQCGSCPGCGPVREQSLTAATIQ